MTHFVFALLLALNHWQMGIPAPKDPPYTRCAYVYGKLVVAKLKYGTKGNPETGVVLLHSKKFAKLTLCGDVTEQFTDLTGVDTLIAYDLQISDSREPCHDLVALLTSHSQLRELPMTYELKDPSDWPNNIRAWMEKHQPVFMIVRTEGDETTHVAGADTEDEAMELAMMWSASGNGKKGHVEVFQRDAEEA